MRWFRFYDEALDDPKVQRLPPDLFKMWVNVLCLASRGGGILPDVEDIAFALRLPVAKVGAQLEMLISAGLLDDGGDDLRPHNWNGRQYDSDSSAERMRRHRQRQRDARSDGGGDVTPSAKLRSRTDTDSEAEQRPPLSPSETSPPRVVTTIQAEPVLPECLDRNKLETKGNGHDRPKRGTRLAADWQPDEQDRKFAHSLGLAADEILAQFRDYWLAKPGAGATKLDWSATWRNWCRKAAEYAPARRATSGFASAVGDWLAQADREGKG